MIDSKMKEALWYGLGEGIKIFIVMLIAELDKPSGTTKKERRK